MILEIERSWAKWPGWFVTLDRDYQIVLLAQHRIRSTPAKTKKTPTPPRTVRGGRSAGRGKAPTRRIKGR